jgi:hypothetical protein
MRENSSENTKPGLRTDRYAVLAIVQATNFPEISEKIPCIKDIVISSNVIDPFARLGMPLTPPFSFKSIETQ